MGISSLWTATLLSLFAINWAAAQEASDDANLGDQLKNQVQEIGQTLD